MHLTSWQISTARVLIPASVQEPGLVRSANICTMYIKEGLVFRQYNQMVSSLLESNHALNICHTSDNFFFRIRKMTFSGGSIRFSSYIDAVNVMAWGAVFMNRVET